MCLSMNVYQTWFLKSFFCNMPDERFKLVPLAYLLDRNHLKPKKPISWQENTLKSNEEKKTVFFGLLTSCLV